MESLFRSPLYGSNNYHRVLDIKELEEEVPSMVNSYDFRGKAGGISRTTAANFTTLQAPADATVTKVVKIRQQVPAMVVVEKSRQLPPSEDINQSAEAFIRKFRQQLLIQRLESIENYEKMLARGTQDT